MARREAESGGTTCAGRRTRGMGGTRRLVGGRLLLHDDGRLLGRVADGGRVRTVDALLLAL